MQGSGGALECGLGSLWDEGWLCGAGGSETPLCRAGQRSDELRSSGDVTNVASPGGWPCGTEPAAARRASEDRRNGEFRRRHPPAEYGFRLDSADRKSVVQGKSVYVRVVLGCRRIIKKKNNKILHDSTHNLYY